MQLSKTMRFLMFFHSQEGKIILISFFKNYKEFVLYTRYSVNYIKTKTDIKTYILNKHSLKLSANNIKAKLLKKRIFF